ncbi:MAG: hypothetical protein WC222_02610 [Parachlamydiales bacterium]|jgi:hypothetical protein
MSTINQYSGLLDLEPFKRDTYWSGLFKCEDKFYQKELFFKSVSTSLLATGLAAVAWGGFYLSAVPLTAGAIAITAGYYFARKMEFPEDSTFQINKAKTEISSRFDAEVYKKHKNEEAALSLFNFHFQRNSNSLENLITFFQDCFEIFSQDAQTMLKTHLKDLASLSSTSFDGKQEKIFQVKFKFTECEMTDIWSARFSAHTFSEMVQNCRTLIPSTALKGALCLKLENNYSLIHCSIAIFESDIPLKSIAEIFNNLKNFNHVVDFLNSNNTDRTINTVVENINLDVFSGPLVEILRDIDRQTPEGIANFKQKIADYCAWQMQLDAGKKQASKIEREMDAIKDSHRTKATEMYMSDSTRTQHPVSWLDELNRLKNAEEQHSAYRASGRELKSIANKKSLVNEALTAVQSKNLVVIKDLCIKVNRSCSTELNIASKQGLFVSSYMWDTSPKWDDLEKILNTILASIEEEEAAEKSQFAGLEEEYLKDEKPYRDAAASYQAQFRKYKKDLSNFIEETLNDNLPKNLAYTEKLIQLEAAKTIVTRLEASFGQPIVFES